MNHVAVRASGLSSSTPTMTIPESSLHLQPPDHLHASVRFDI
ncbi:hypothetical protein SLEP1_g867 [Rubroshorea leprosula]|uniref:Uncharacterized protein n=1 Tax=Rubroshorea leprosula TaxID=152421 RepID=A0AAV5HHU0_9ROSI|nr:hypothetical protein SLEP1_g867 [Rubroshorea leprosula]